MTDDEDVPYRDGCDDPVLPQFVRPFDVEPLDVYGYGSDPTNADWLRSPRTCSGRTVPTIPTSRRWAGCCTASRTRQADAHGPQAPQRGDFRRVARFA